MDKPDSGGRSNAAIRVRLFQSDGSDDPDDAGVRSLAQGGATDYENDDGDDDNSLDEQASNNAVLSVESGRMATVGSTPPLDSRGLPSADGVDSVSSNHVRQRVSDDGTVDSDTETANSLLTPRTNSHQLDDVAAGFLIANVGRRLSSPGEGFSDERDPNYAVQRPDTLGAINAADNGQAVTAANVALPVARNAGQPRYPAIPAAARFWSTESAAEGSSFADDAGAQLGRRTRGAGMDQLEMNQRQQLPSDSEDDDPSEDGEGSELCEEDDNGVRDANQCESTEADQYKMDPEADQTNAVSTSRPLLANNSRDPNVIPAAVSHRPADRNGASAALSSDDTQDTDRAEDDQEELDANPSNAFFVDLPLEAASNAGRTVQQLDDRKRGGPVSLPMHPLSAFSLPKPRCPPTQHLAPPDDQSSGTVHQQQQNASKVHADAVFKPICSFAMRTSRPEPMDSIDGSDVPDELPKRPDRNANPTSNINPLSAATKPADQIGAVRRSHDSMLQSHSDQQSVSVNQLHKPDHARREIRDRISSMTDAVTDGMHAIPDHGSFGLPMKRAQQDPNRPSKVGDVRMEFPNIIGGGANSVSMLSSQNLRGSGTFAPPDSSSQQTTPMKAGVRPFQPIDDSLEMSPIRPASSVGSRPLSLDAVSLRGAFMTQTDHYLPALCLPRKAAGGTGTSEIHDMEQLRGQLQQLLLMSDRNIPDKAAYDQSNDDVDELLAGHTLGHTTDSYWSHFSGGGETLSALQDALPLSSKYLVPSSANSVVSGQHRLDAATLLAENRALQDAMEQQRFKLKHCEKQIRQLQGKVLELQQDLAVAVSTDHKKDVMIEQLDKALFKVVEGWRQKESERQEVVHHLQLEKNALQQALESQQQVVGRFEKQLKQTIQQMQSEQQRTANAVGEKDRQLSEVQRECERLQEDLDRERDQCRRLLDAERCDAAAAKSKVQAQMGQLKAAYEEERKNWDAKERHYLQKMDEMTDNHVETMEQQKRQLEKQQQVYAELQSVQRATQMDVEKLQLELDTITRERESLKVELSLAEARIESSKRKIEAELQMEAERELSGRLDEAARRHSENERRIHDTHRSHLQELAEQHRAELQRLGAEHEESLRWLEDKHRQDAQQREDRIIELENEISALSDDNKRIQLRNHEVSSQLQSMMQSHCSEALRLLQLAGGSVPGLMSTSEDVMQSIGNSDRSLPVRSTSATSFRPLEESPRDSFTAGRSSAIRQSHRLPLDDDASPRSTMRQHGHDTAQHGHNGLPQTHNGPQQHQSHDAVPAAAAAVSATGHLSAQYSQFLASVRGFQPLLADLNASIASVANSVTTVDADVRGKPSFNGAPAAASGGLAGRQRVGSDGDIWLHSPVLMQSTEVSPDDAVVCADGSRMRTENGLTSGDEGTPLSTTAGSRGGGTLFTQILQQEGSSGNNTSGDSIGFDQQRHMMSNGIHNSGGASPSDRIYQRSSSEGLVSKPERLQQHDQRHQELQHYIRILLQRSPGTTSETEDQTVDGNQNVGSAARVPPVMNGTGASPRAENRTPNTDTSRLRSREARTPEVEPPRLLTQPATEVPGVLTSSQVNEMSHLLQRHHKAMASGGGSAGGFAANAADIENLLSYLRSAQQCNHNGTNGRTADVTSVGVRHQSNEQVFELNRRHDNNSNNSNSNAVQVQTGVEAARGISIKPCRQSVTPTDRGGSNGHGRPDVITDHSRHIKPARNEPAVKASKSTSSVSDSGAKKLEKRAAPPPGGGAGGGAKNSNKAPSVWK